MKKYSLIFITAIVLFVELLDSTITHTALTKMAHDFGVSFSQMTGSIICYILGTCIFIPAVSYLKNRLSPKNILFYCITLFGISSILAGVSHTLYVFCIFRFFQGLSMSICYPLCMILIYEDCNNKDIAKLNSIINIPALAGLALGPFIGSVFTEYMTWRISFFINIPVCFLLLYLVSLLKENKSSRQNTQFDFLGFSFISIGLSFLTVGFELLINANISPSIRYFIILFGLFLLILYIITYLISPKKRVIYLGVFKQKNYTIGTLINLFSRISTGGFQFLLIVFLQSELKYSLVKTGFVLLVMSFSGLIAKIFINKLVDCFSIYYLNSVFVFLTSLSLLSFLFINRESSFNSVCILVSVYGFIISILFTCMNTIPFVNIPNNLISNASNLQSIFQQLFLGIGVFFSFILINKLKEKSILFFNINLFEYEQFHREIFILATIFIIGLTLTAIISKLNIFLVNEKTKQPERISGSGNNASSGV